MVKRANFSCQGRGIGSQQLHGNLQPSAALISSDLSGLSNALGTHAET